MVLHSTAQPTSKQSLPPLLPRTTTVTLAGSSVPTLIVKNGGFENGFIPWTVAIITTPFPDSAQKKSIFVDELVHKSPNVFTINGNAASSHLKLNLSQTITLCAGQKSIV